MMLSIRTICGTEQKHERFFLCKMVVRTNHMVLHSFYFEMLI